MTRAETSLRSAWLWAQQQDSGLARKLAEDFSEVRFLADDPGLKGPSLRARTACGNGALAVYFTPGGRNLKIVAKWTDGGSFELRYHNVPKEIRP